MSKPAVVHVDYTHVGRRASGIERITVELFNSKALEPLNVRPFEANRSLFGIVGAQMIGLPLCAIGHPRDVFVFPGYPPSPYFSLARGRSVLYVHDMFLLTRREDLNRAARYYMAPLFHVGVKCFRYFLTNSLETANQLRRYCNPAAEIIPYRPRIRNVFGLTGTDRQGRSSGPEKLRVVAIGTVEPRKNFVAAAEICSALASRLGREVELQIIGRAGWGDDAQRLKNRPNVILHDFLSDPEARHVIQAADLVICTSHDEGLGLSLLEVQFGGLPVVAPDKPIFREVLGSSGIFIDIQSPKNAADRIAGALGVDGWREQYIASSTSNLERWNELADSDHGSVISFLTRLIPPN